jgi:TonB family protein
VSTRQSRFNVGDVIDGKYEVVKVLPAGGMGELYKVRHVHLNDFRAVKVLKKNLLTDATQKQRFLREAKIAASIKNPNLASLFDFSSLQDGSYYMVQEFIDGVTLADRMRSGERFDVPFVVRVAQQVLGGIAALHEEGIIHRDISPDNLMLTRSTSGATNIKVIDLGIAKPMDAGEGLTSAGFFVGKLHYASPEQAGMIEPGEKVDRRTDLYSLGVVLYQMVTSRMPFSATSPQSYFLKQVSEEVAPINQPGEPPLLPTDVEQFILRMLRKDRNERFSSAAEAIQHLSVIGAKYSATGAAQPLTAPPPAPPFEQAREEELGETVVGPLADLKAEAHKVIGEDMFAGPPDAPIFSDRVYGEETELAGEEDRITAEHPIVASEPSGWEASLEDATAVAPPDLRQSTLASQILGAFGSPPATPPDNSASRRPSGSPPATPPDDSASRRPAPPAPTMVETPIPSSSMPTMVETPFPLHTYVEQPVPPSTIMQPAHPSNQPTTVMPMVTPPGAQPPMGQPPVAGTVMTGQKKGGSGLLLLFAFLVLLFLGVAAAAAWFLLGRRGEEAQTASTETVAPTPIPTPVPVITPDTSLMTSTMLPNTDTTLTDTTLTDTTLSDTTLTGLPTITPAATPRPTATPRRRRSPTPTPRATPTPRVVQTATPAAPPEPVREGDLARLGEAGVDDARISRWHTVTYPRAAERMRAAGTTDLQVLVGIDGKAEQVRVTKSSGFAVLDDEAQNVARRSTYSAARKQGVRVRMWIPLRVTFQRP